MFNLIGIREPPGYDSDHKAIVGVIQASTPREHHNYLGGRKSFPLHVLKGTCHLVIWSSNVFRRHNGSWLRRQVLDGLLGFWRILGEWSVDEQASGRQSGLLNGEALQCLNWAIQRSLRTDRKKRVELASADIETQLRENDLKGAWGLLKWWYCQCSGKPPKPSRMDFAIIEQEYGNLYRAHAPPGEPVLSTMLPFDILDNTPEEEEIVECVKHLKSGKAAGPSGMRAEHLKEWCEDREGAC
jgi:hypothetical protein